jgi:hypothetical protein
MDILQRILMEQDPTGWRMMNGCILLNLTRRQQVDLVYPELFRCYPDPGHMRNAWQTDLADKLRPLGLQYRRAETLRKFSDWWCRAWDPGEDMTITLGQVPYPSSFLERIRAMEPPGIGEYARDSWAIFVEGIVPDWEVNDHALLEHLSELDPMMWCTDRRPWEPEAYWAERIR